jgi:hypothetical protein
MRPREGFWEVASLDYTYGMQHHVTNETTLIDKLKANRKLLLTYLAAVAASALLITAAWYGYAYASSPDTIRHPSLEHYHFRMMLTIDGKYVDLGDKRFQQGYAKDQCSGDLPTNPIHAHDNKDQFVHIHWEGITGGEVLKYYGLNYIGGDNRLLGYRFDQGTKPYAVTIYDKALPTPKDNDTFWIYTGNEDGYKERSWDDFLHKDLEKFFGVTSNFPGHKDRSSLMDFFFPKAYAHTGHAHTETTMTEEELTEINNLLGNVVIFAQPKKPTDAQIKHRFERMEPLSESTCGG